MSYRGISRRSVADLIGWTVEGNLAQVREYLTSFTHVWANFQEQENKGFSPDTIPATVEFTSELVELFSGIRWEQLPTCIPRHFEFVAAVGMDRKVEQVHIKEIVKTAVANNGVLCRRAARFYGFDMVEWPSNWSVPAHSLQWSAAGFALNSCHLCADWEAVEKMWEAYLGVHDPERGPLDAYRRIAVVGLGRVLGGSPASH